MVDVLSSLFSSPYGHSSFGNKVKIGNKVQFGDRFKNWCNV